MGCFSFKSKTNILIDIPNFKSRRKKIEIEDDDELKFFEDFFENHLQTNFVQLNLSSNDLRNKRLKLNR